MDSSNSLSISVDELRQFARVGAQIQLDTILTEFPELREQLTFGTNGHPVPKMPVRLALRADRAALAHPAVARPKRGRPRKPRKPAEATTTTFPPTTTINDAILQVVAAHTPLTGAEVVSHLEAGGFANTKSKNLKGLVSATMGRMAAQLGLLRHGPKGPLGAPALWEVTAAGLKLLANGGTRQRELN